MKWLAVTTITNAIRNGYSSHSTLTIRWRASFASGHPTIRANATCIEGTAAYGLNRVLAIALWWETWTPVRFETVSMKPHSGMKRGGAVGNTV